jgi:hypothetical protein
VQLEWSGAWGGVVVFYTPPPPGPPPPPPPGLFESDASRRISVLHCYVDQLS